MKGFRKFGWGVAWTGIFLMILSTAESGADPFIRFSRWSGSLELGVHGAKQDSKNITGDSMLRRVRWEERFRLAVEAFVVDPAFARLNLAGTLGFWQEDLKQDGRNLDGDGRLREYDLSANWFDPKPVRLKTFANRTEQIVSRELAPQTEVRHESRGAGLQVDSLPLPSHLSIRYQRLFRESAFAGDTIQWDQVRREVVYRGSRRERAMNLNLQYRFEDLDDRIRPDFDRKTHTGGLSHRWTPGGGGSSGFSLNTAARYSRQKGPQRLVFGSFYGSEQMDFSLPRRFTGTLGLILSGRRVEDRDQDLDDRTTMMTGFGNLSHQLYESLTSRLTGDWVRTDFPIGDEKRYRGRLSLDYRKRIPAGGRLLIGFNSRYEQVDRGAIGQTIVEEYDVLQAPPFQFELVLSVATLSNLTIQNPGKGIFLVEGEDYTVIVTGDRVIIDVITTLTTRVDVGDRLLIRYEVLTQSPIRFETLGLGGSFGVDFNWIGFSFRHERQGQDRISGSDAGLLDDMTWNTASLHFHLRPFTGNLVLLNEFQTYDSRQLDYTERRFSQVLTYPLMTGLSTTVQSNESLTAYDIPDRRTRRVGVRVYLRWRAGGNTEVAPFGAYRRFNDTTAPDEKVWTGGIRARQAWGRLGGTGFAQYEKRDRNGSEIDDYQFNLQLTRRF